MLNKENYILVTGASSGLGHSLAVKFLENNFKVIAVSKDKEKLIKSFSENSNIDKNIIEKNLVTIASDLSEIEKNDEFLKNINDNYGALSGAFLSHGIYKLIPSHIMKCSMIKDFFETNTLSVINLSTSLSKKGYLLEGSSILLMSSLAAHESIMGSSLYSATKAALEGFVTTIKDELFSKKIKINALAPGIIKTKINEKLFDNLSGEQLENLKKEYPNGFINLNEFTKLIYEILNSNVYGRVIKIKSDEDILNTIESFNR